MHLGYIKSQHKYDKSFLKGAWSGSRDPFLKNFAPKHIFVIIGEARHALQISSTG